MSNKVKINGKSPKQEPVMEAVSSEDAHIDEITQKVRQAYKDEAEVKGKMMELANIHIEAHSFSLSYWDAKMKEAIQTIDDGRKIYTGSWEGRLLWLERAAQLMQVDVTRSAEYNNGEMHLYWSDVDGEIMMKDGEPELRIESMDHLKSLNLIKVAGDEPINADG